MVNRSRRICFTTIQDVREYACRHAKFQDTPTQKQHAFIAYRAIHHAKTLREFEGLLAFVVEQNRCLQSEKRLFQWYIDHIDQVSLAEGK